MVEELFVKPAKALKDIAPKKNATSRLETNSAFGVAIPALINGGGKALRKMRKPIEFERGDQVTERRRNRPRWILERTVRIKHTTAEGTSFGMSVRIRDQLIQRAIENDGVGI